MATSHEAHGHAHQVIQLFEAETVTASIEVTHRVATLTFHERGVGLHLTEKEARELRAALEAITAHLDATSSA